MHYDAAIADAYPQLLASRRNYDVAVGRSEHGALEHGVLEQSWRIGGATPAEVVALAAFAADQKLQRVNASSHEVYDLIDPPPGAEVYFRAVDPAVGALTKYTLTNDALINHTLVDHVDHHGR